MKKILIASACALTLCLTSCASKQAPEEKNPIETPQLEDSLESKDTDIQGDEEKESETSEQEDENLAENQDEAETSDTEIIENDAQADSNTFPEPETLEEPEVITLEPEEEIIEEIEAEETEPVENEEPPEITVIVDNEENPSESDSIEDITPAQDSTDLVTDEENNVEEDITANDVIIEENSADSDSISGGIDITDDESDSNEDVSENNNEIIPSRSVSLKKFEYLDVTYPGTGWIYMGLTDNSKDLAYFGRKLGTKDTKFTLQARAAGRKIIHFYKNDPLTGQYLDDYIEVIIEAENGSNKTHIEAPEYKLPVQKKESEIQTEKDIETSEEEVLSSTQVTSNTSAKDIAEKEETKDKENTQTTKASQTSQATQNAAVSSVSQENQTTASQTDTTEDTTTATESSVTVLNTATLLQEAQLLYNEKEYSKALEKLNQFFEFSTDNRDQALYLKGQILEAKSDVRDIKGALDAYSTLTKNYPSSKYWDSANKRIIYLKRFYLEVR